MLTARAHPLDPCLRALPGEPAAAAASLDSQEARFLSNFVDLLAAGQYKLLSATEWDAACAEEFLLTLPVSAAAARRPPPRRPRPGAGACGAAAPGRPLAVPILRPLPHPPSPPPALSPQP
jgi:hypothetical protein